MRCHPAPRAAGTAPAGSTLVTADGVTKFGLASADAKSAADRNRSAGIFDNAFPIAAAT